MQREQMASQVPSFAFYHRQIFGRADPSMHLLFHWQPHLAPQALPVAGTGQAALTQLLLQDLRLWAPVGRVP